MYIREWFFAAGGKLSLLRDSVLFKLDGYEFEFVLTASVEESLDQAFDYFILWLVEKMTEKLKEKICHE